MISSPPLKDGMQLNLRASPGEAHLHSWHLRVRAIRLKGAAPPVKGRANPEVERFLASLLGVPPSKVSVTRDPRESIR